MFIESVAFQFGESRKSPTTIMNKSHTTSLSRYSCKLNLSDINALIFSSVKMPTFSFVFSLPNCAAIHNYFDFAFIKF